MAVDTHKDIDELKAQVSNLRSDITSIADTLSRLSGDAVADGRDRFKHTAEQQRRKARETWEAIEHEIGERPLTSVVAAFGVGFALAKLLDH